MQIDRSLPSLGTVRNALESVTQHLASELDQSTSAAPPWSSLEWRLAPAASAIHGISALLAADLRWRGPEPWTTFLSQQREFTRERFRCAGALLAKIDDLARGEGVALTALKGAALYSLGVYAPGERPMADLDLLVRPDSLSGAERVLAAAGYRELGASWKHRSYAFGTAEMRFRLGEDPASPPLIDLHTRIAERLPHQIVDLSDIVAGRPEPGLNGYPSLAALMVHLLAHSAGSMVQRELRLIQLVDLVRVSRRLTRGDWAAIVEWDGQEHRLWWAFAPLMLARSCFPQLALPPEADLLSQGCPGRLRRLVRRRSLAGLSFSCMFYTRFPGISWSRSYRDALGYVLDRVLHARAQLVHGRLLNDTESWTAGVRGPNRSQLVRVVRGLLARPLRRNTMRVVRAALEKVP